MVEFEDMSLESIRKAVQRKFGVDVEEIPIEYFDSTQLRWKEQVYLCATLEDLKTDFIEVSNEILDGCEDYRIYVPKYIDGGWSFLRRIKK